MTLQRDIQLACVLEATARKPGNVHPAHGFSDLCYQDFVRSAEVVAPLLACVSEVGVGQAILDSAQATQHHVGKNTNLGILLLLAPLAAIPEGHPADAVGCILDGLDSDGLTDSIKVYEAIRICHPGGMGDVEDQSIHAPPSLPLVDCMKLAADRDTIARQYCDGYQLVRQHAVALIGDSFEDNWEQSIIRLQLSLLASTPDSLIARKCGLDAANEVSQMAADALSQLPDCFEANDPALRTLDAHLRSDGHRLNPGTTADLVAACLFVALRQQTITWSGTIDLAAVAEEFAAAAG